MNVKKKSLRERFLELSDEDLSRTVHNFEVEMTIYYDSADTIDDLNKQLQVAKQVLAERRGNDRS